MCWLLFWHQDLHFHQIIVNLIDSCYNHQFHVTCLFYVFVLCDYHQYHGVLVRWRCSCGDTFTCNCPILVLNKVYYYYYYYYITHYHIHSQLRIAIRTLVATMECSNVAGAGDAARRYKGGTDLAAIALAWFTLDGFILSLLKFGPT